MKVLFVCTGNIFRSMSADLCLRDYITKQKITDIISSSAGLHAYPEPVSEYVAFALDKFGIDCSKHKQRRLSTEILSEADVVVAMADYHQDAILKKFGVKSYLFNEIAIGRKISVLDVEDVIHDLTNTNAIAEHEIRTVEHIHNSIPNFVRNVGKFLEK